MTTRVETSCIGCGQGFSLDETFVGSTLPCPACGHEEGLVVEAARRTLPLSAPHEVDRGSTAPASPAQVAAPEQVAAPAPAPVAEGAAAVEVVCPRCQLHFMPRGSAPARVSQATVLIVEGMDYFRETVQQALSPRYGVRAAANLAEARALLAAGGIDLIVLDPSLGGGEQGIDLLRELPVKPCPILVFSDEDESEMYGTKWKAMQALGVDDLIMKGMNVEESLLRKVGALLGEKPAADE